MHQAYKTVHSILHVCVEGVCQAYKTLHSILHVCVEDVHQTYKTIHSIFQVRACLIVETEVGERTRKIIPNIYEL